jgi:hypothetical protein
MSDVAPEPRAVRRPPLPFLLALGLLTVLFVALAIRRSDRTTLRGDELYTVMTTRDEPDVGKLLLSGVSGQISPAPMYYFIHRGVDALRRQVDYLGLNYPGYFRLTSVMFTAGFGAAAALLLAWRLARTGGSIDPIPGLLVLCGLAVFWFQPKVFSFACTARPYAFWNGLWLFTLAWLLCRPESHIGLLILLSLLATIATAAAFQIFAVAVAFVVSRRLEGRSLREILRDGALVFAVPTLLAVYYSMRVRIGAPEEAADPVTGLLKFWLVTNLPAWIAAATALFLVLSRPAPRPLLLPVGAFSVLLLIVPLIFALAWMKGYASPSRRFMWTTTGIPLALFVAALAGPEHPRWRAARPWTAVLAVSLAVGFSIATAVRPPLRNDSRRLACLDPGTTLEQLLSRERPVLLALPPQGKDEIDLTNVVLLAEWIESRYRSRRSGKLTVPFRVEGGELRSETPTNEVNLPDEYILISGSR